MTLEYWQMLIFIFKGLIGVIKYFESQQPPIKARNHHRWWLLRARLEIIPSPDSPLESGGIPLSVIRKATTVTLSAVM